MRPMRIASLLPSATEIVADLGLADQLVAVSHECDFPRGVEVLPHATRSLIDPVTMTPAEIDAAVSRAAREGRSLYEVRSEVLEQARPDLIVTQGLCDVCAVSGATVAQSLACDLRGPVADAKVVALSGGDLEGIFADLELVGRTAGAGDRAAQRVDALRRRWRSMAERPPQDTRPTAILLEWTDPPFTGGHWIPEMVEVAGGHHLLGDPGETSARHPWEAIVEADPDLLLVAACGYGLEANVELAEQVRQRPEASRLRAVQEGRLWAFDANAHFSRPGPRVVRGAELLAEVFAGREPPAQQARRVTPARRC